MNLFLKTSFDFVSRECLRNGVPDTSGEAVERLNPLANPLAYILDGKDSTKWISRPEIYMPGGLTLVVDLLNGEYEVTLYFLDSLQEILVAFIGAIRAKPGLR